MTKLAELTIRKFASGLELGLRWSKDESVVMLFIWRPQLGEEIGTETKLIMTPAQLDELRGFIMDNLD